MSAPDESDLEAERMHRVQTILFTVLSPCSAALHEGSDRCTGGADPRQRLEPPRSDGGPP